MKKIREYQALESEDSISNLNEMVDGEILNGWQPFHGISVSVVQSHSGGYMTVFAQAMVKYED
jgi:hypothetical protein